MCRADWVLSLSGLSAAATRKHRCWLLIRWLAISCCYQYLLPNKILCYFCFNFSYTLPPFKLCRSSRKYLTDLPLAFTWHPDTLHCFICRFLFSRDCVCRPNILDLDAATLKLQKYGLNPGHTYGIMCMAIGFIIIATQIFLNVKYSPLFAHPQIPLWLVLS